MKTRTRKHPPRKGPNAIHGGTRGTPMKTWYVCAVKPKVKREKVEPPTESIAQLYGNDAPAGEMTDMRIRLAYWEKRKDKQREISRKQLAKSA